MTSVPLIRRRAVLATLASPLLVAACGKGGGGGSGSLRAINLTDDLASADLYLSGTQLLFSSLTTGVMSSFSSVDANTYSLNINSAGSTTSLFTGSYTISKDAHYSAIIWGPQSALHVNTLPEDDDTTQIGTGNSRVRMFSATTQVGSVDIYLTAATADLGTSLPTQASLSSGSISGFHEIPAGTYRLRITGAGVPTDLRLDVPAVTFTAAQYSTIVLTAGAGGVLVNGTLIVEQGAATTLTTSGTTGTVSNQQARVRMLASVDNAGLVSATVGSTTVATSLLSPVTGPYVLVDSGNTTLSVTINGAPVLTGSLTLEPGADYSLLVYGDPTAPLLTTITDDNSLPVTATGTSRTKIRLINGVAGLDALTLQVDNGVVPQSTPTHLSDDVPAGSAGPYAQIASDTQAFIQVTSPTLGYIYQSTRTNGDSLAAQGVYTMFVLGGKSAPYAFLRNERPS